LIEELFVWAKNIELHPVLKGIIVHFEIETVHPFADGNGRMGRLWQTLILAKWNRVFAWLPMESPVYENKLKYYEAIKNSYKNNDSSEFLEFILSSVLDTVEAQSKQQEKHKDEHIVEHIVKHIVEHSDDNIVEQKNEYIIELLTKQLSETKILIINALILKSLSRNEIFDAIGMKNDFRSFKRNIEPLLIDKIIEMTIPDKPSSKYQKYMLTEKGNYIIKKLTESLTSKKGE
jgi:Fic family protein